MNDGITDELLIRFLYGEADEEEQARVARWLQRQEDHKRYLEQLRFLQQQSRIKRPPARLNVDREWEAFQSRLARDESLPPRNRLNKLRLAAIAAAMAVTLLLAGMLIYSNVKQQPVIVKAGDAIVTDTLPDGSVVTLNKGAVLSYQKDFNQNRALKLQGEGFFEVVPDKSRPFVVMAEAIRIKVVGTSFNVRSSPGRTEVVVETGKVEVSNKDKKISLLPHEKGIAVPASGLLTREEEASQLYNYYRSNLFICKGTSLGELVTVLNAAYDKDISVPDPATRAVKITATYERTSFDEILNIVCSTLGLRAEKNGRSIILR